MIQPGTCLLRKLSSEAYRAQGDKTFISFYRKSVSNEIVLRERIHTGFLAAACCSASRKPSNRSAKHSQAAANSSALTEKWSH